MKPLCPSASSSRRQTPPDFEPKGFSPTRPRCLSSPLLQLLLRLEFTCLLPCVSRRPCFPVRSVGTVSLIRQARTLRQSPRPSGDSGPLGSGRWSRSRTHAGAFVGSLASFFFTSSPGGRSRCAESKSLHSSPFPFLLRGLVVFSPPRSL